MSRYYTEFTQNKLIFVLNYKFLKNISFRIPVASGVSNTF